MRFRLGRTLRFIIVLVSLILLIPFLMSKLNSTTNQSTAEDNEVDYFNVKNKMFFFLFVNFYLEYIEQES